MDNSTGQYIEVCLNTGAQFEFNFFTDALLPPTGSIYILQAMNYTDFVQYILYKYNKYLNMNELSTLKLIFRFVRFCYRFILK